MKTIGVTGGIGGGKSTVSRLLKELGAVVIDADVLSRECTETGKPALLKITEAFGSGVLKEDGSLDRKKLADRIFANPEERKVLEAIIHTEVIAEMARQLSVLRQQGYKGMAALDVPIPVKKGFLDTVEEVWVVACNQEERIRRIMARSGLSREEAEKRIGSQLSQEDYLALAHRVIWNQGSMDNLREEVARLYGEVMIKKN